MKYIQENNVVVEVLIVSVIKLHGKLFYTVFENHLDQWNARHVTLFSFDNHAFLFFSTFRQIIYPALTGGHANSTMRLMLFWVLDLLPLLHSF